MMTRTRIQKLVPRQMRVSLGTKRKTPKMKTTTQKTTNTITTMKIQTIIIINLTTTIIIIIKVRIMIIIEIRKLVRMTHIAEKTLIIKAITTDFLGLKRHRSKMSRTRTSVNMMTKKMKRTTTMMRRKLKW